jgi:hypothetical protein
MLDIDGKMNFIAVLLMGFSVPISGIRQTTSLHAIIKETYQIMLL